MNKGWVSIHRRIKDHWVWDKSRVFSEAEAWIDLLLYATHEEQTVKIKNTLFTVRRGQQIRSLKTLSQEWNWSRSKVKRFLDLLESDNMVVLKNETITTRITICNYDTYQGLRNTDETQVKRKRNASETQVNTDNNDNNAKNENNENNILSESVIEEAKVVSESTNQIEAFTDVVVESESVYEFDAFWDDYGKKVGKKEVVEGWKKLKESDKRQIKEFLPIYLMAKPRIKHRLDPVRFIKYRRWEDDRETWIQLAHEEQKNNRGIKNERPINQAQINDTVKRFQEV